MAGLVPRIGLAHRSRARSNRDSPEPSAIPPKQSHDHWDDSDIGLDAEETSDTKRRALPATRHLVLTEIWFQIPTKWS